ncbi:lactonase family protein [Bacillus ndiopicus]|uniref:lactonase family protein n=1 Tax=Bacillus ndiopicus TaxID=1347368 RepID=UPI0005A88635|nr:lactonase family protein [Bacillus ndiopicus]
MKNTIDLIIGTYQKADTKALEIITLDTQSVEIQHKTAIKGINSPSFIAVYQSYIFAVSEEDDGYVCSYRYDSKQQQLIELSRQSTHGAAPCYVLYDADKRALYVTNYVSGSIAVFAVNEQFEIEPCKQVLQHTGSSINKERQEAAHAHSIEILPFASDFKIVQDLGCDTITLYLTTKDGMLTHINTFQMPLGSGPRHVAFHKEHKLVYVLSELSSTVDVLQFDESEQTFKLIQSISTLPKDFSAESTGADIHVSPSGKYLFTSNRGHDSIAVFTISERGQLTWSHYIQTGGETPRNFSVISEELIMIGNQNSNKITLVKMNDSGLLELQNTEYAIEKPVCLKVIK